MPPAARSTPSLKDLVKEPFGPYLEEHVLTAVLKNTTKKRPIALECLLLEAGGTITGLTECEYTQPEYDKEKFDNVPIRFHGTLEILYLSWLTPAAIDSIQDELRERDVRSRSSIHKNAEHSDITLKALYGQTPGFQGGQIRIKVIIMGVKNEPANYLLSNIVPDGLMINTRKRAYAVNSMHILSYELSRAYLSRYRLFHTLRRLLALDAGSNSWMNNKTPLHKRTPEWFADLYLNHMAYAYSSRQHRPNYTDSDSDIEPGSSGVMKTGREHTLRHVSRAEVLSRIAEHALWIVLEIDGMDHFKWIDTDVWKRWLKGAQRIRRKAADAGRRWGIWDGKDAPLDELMDLDDLPLPAKHKRKKKKGQRRASKRKRDAATAPTFWNLPSGVGRDEEYDPDVDITMQRTYDRDFSPVSTTLGDDSDSESPPSSRAHTPVDPDLLALLPSAFFHPPNVTSTFQWACSVGGCNYTIDLLNLTDENLDTNDITEEEKVLLRSKQWDAREIWVREAFACMVDKHHDVHIDEWGINFEQVNGKWKASWKHPESHLRLSRFRKVRKDDRQQEIKVEAVEEI